MENLLLLGLVWLALYLASCAIWPYKACGRCKGSPRNFSPTGVAWRNCGKCGGSGRKIRWGRHIFPGSPG